METRQFVPGLVGLVLAEHTEVILRELSPSYLRAAWEKADAFFAEERVDVDGISWGQLHAGVAVRPARSDSPLDWTGFLSARLFTLSDRKLEGLTERARSLEESSPRLAFVSSYRAWSYEGAPADGAAGVSVVSSALLEAPNEWLHPVWYEEASTFKGQPHVGRMLATAIASGVPEKIAEALESARTHYSSTGHAIASAAVTAYLAGPR